MKQQGLQFMPHTSESLQAAFKYLFPNEVPALKQLAQCLPPNPVVINIGAGSGTSGLAFMESRDDLQLVTIDIQHDDSPFGCLVAEENVLKEAGLWNLRVSHIWGDSVVISRKWVIPVDMVFIDADHSYFGCKSDIQSWLPNLKPRGIIAIHDYMKSNLYAHEKDYQPDKPHPKNWPGVDRAVNELLLDKYEMALHVDSLIAFRIP